MEVDNIQDGEGVEYKKDVLPENKPFEVVLKGGSPWGFTLRGGIEIQSPIQISQIEPGSKACDCGKLLAGDYILSVNHVKSQSLTEAVQLIQDAFRTLTLTVWRSTDQNPTKPVVAEIKRGTSKLESSVKILRSSSFLQRAREVQERERQRLGSQDDSAVPKEQSGSTDRMKPGTRRIESFHGTRTSRFRNSSGSTSSVTPVASPVRPEAARTDSQSSITTDKDGSDDGGFNEAKQMELSAKEKLRGWATIQDLSQEQLARKKLEQSAGNHSNSNVTNQSSQHRSGPLSTAMSSPSLALADQQQHYHQSISQSQRLNIAPSKSSPDVGDIRNQPTTPRSPTSPMGLYNSASPQARSGFQYPQGYHKMAWGNKENMKNLQYGYNMYKSEDVNLKNNSPNVPQSVPLSSDSHDYQNINDLKSEEMKNQQIYSQPYTTKDLDGDKEVQKLTSKPLDFDPRPPCSPPAPPVRDLSSLKFSQRSQSHEKYPSWPVTQPSIETEAGEPLTSPKSKVNYHPQLGTVKERNNSPNSERKSSDEYKRNASDPGFKKPIPFSNFMQRPKQKDLLQRSKNKEEIMKQTAETMNEFFNSQPGYPQPQLDQDGHHLGDEKYNIPSPPERDNGHVPDQKTLSEKIASIVGPHHDTYHGSYLSDSKKLHDFSSSLYQSPSQDAKRDIHKRGSSPHLPGNSQSKNVPSQKVHALVDTGTSPLNSPDGSKFTSSNSSGQLFKQKDRPSETSAQYYDQHRSFIVKQMVCYNTGTQTESDFQNSKELSPSWNKEQDRGKFVQPRGSNSDSENVGKFGASDSLRNSSSGADTQSYGANVNRYSGNSERDFARRNRNSSGNESDSKDLAQHYSEYPANMAPMLRKLTHEYYGGKLHGSITEKRLSSASSQDSSLRSPGSDYPAHLGQYSGMKEAESYNSIIIHPQENPMPFGREYNPDLRSSTSESVSTEADRNTNKSSEPRSAFKPGRHSLDPTMFSPKYPLINSGSKSVHDPRYSSEANLQSPMYSHRDYGGSMMSLQSKHLKTASLSDEMQSRLYHRGSDSSQPRTSSDSRSSGSNRYSSDSSPLAPQGQYKMPRRESSDSVFVESPSQIESSPGLSSSSIRRPNDLNVTPTRNMNRSASMKKAYGVYDEFEKSHSALGMHKRQESDLTSNSSHYSDGSNNVLHSRSQSQSDYMQMDNYRRMQEEKHLALIREDSSENRWEEAVRKSKSLTHRSLNSSSSEKQESNYANVFQSRNQNSDISKSQGAESTRSERSSLKRTSSEQIRPKKVQKHLQSPNSISMSDNSGRMQRPLFTEMKDWKNSLNSQSSSSTMSVGSPSQSQVDLRQRPDSLSHTPDKSQQNFRNLSDSDKNVPIQLDSRLRSASDSSVKDDRNSQTQHAPDSETKKEGQEEIAQSPSGSVRDTDIRKVQRDALKDYVDRKTNRYSSDSNDEQSLRRDEPLFSDKEKPTGSTLTPTESFRQKYAHRAERHESLRRSRSISSRDSDYMEMKRPERPHPQTEWSRIRSQTSNGRPHSIGSDSSLVDPYAVTTLSATSSYMKDHHPESDNHQRSQSDSASVQKNNHTELQTEPVKDTQYQEDEASSGGISKNSFIYQNVGLRRPPPVPPRSEEDKPPALPPRNYRRFPNSQSDSSLLPQQRQQPQPQVEGVHKNEQLEDGRVDPPKSKWDDTSDNYAEQLRKQAKRMPTPMSYISTKTKINYTQSYKRQPIEALEATSPGGLNSPSGDQTSPTTPSGHMVPPSPPARPQMASPVQSPPHTPPSTSSPNHQSPTTVTESVPDRPRPRLSSPTSDWRPSQTLGSPEPPPPPTPQKELPDNLGDLPPPPPEVIENSLPNSEDNAEDQESDGYAVDSYGSYKNKSNRQPGVYKRSVSTGDALKLIQENNNYKHQSEIQKPPRKRLQQQSWKSDLDIQQHSGEPDSGGVPAFKASESVPVSSVQKFVAKPLVHSQSANYLYAPKPYNSPDSTQNKHYDSSEFSQNNIPPHASSNQIPDRPTSEQNALPATTNTPSNQNGDRITVRDRISSFEKKPQNDRPASSKSNTPTTVSMRQPIDNFSRSSHEISLRRSFEIPPTNNGSKLSSSYSESKLPRHSNENINESSSGPATPPRKPSLTSDHNRINFIGHYGGTTRDPPPVDRSPHTGYPGPGPSDDRVQKHRGSFDSVSNHPRQYERYDQHRRSNSGSSSQTDISNKSFENSDYRRQSLDQNNDSISQERNKQFSSPSSSKDVDSLNSPPTANHGRQRSQEELECDAKVQEFASKYKEEDPKLSTVLRTDTVGRMQYMDGLFPMDVDKEKLNSRRSPKHSPKSSSVSENRDAINETPVKEENRVQEDKLEKSPIPSSYWVSPSKAIIEMDIRKRDEIGKEMTKDIGDSDTLIKTKEELVQSIQRKMEKLQEEKNALMSEITETDKIGKQVELVVEQKCQSKQEKDKFKSYVTDMEKITKLLLKLSGLLARAENALQSLPETADDRQKKMASDKRDKLQQQHKEAKTLKEDIDKRSKQVSTFLKESLSESELGDYDYFIRMKSKQMIEVQELEDKITLGKEQIVALRRSIPDKH